jgi:hypothetical protein
MAASLSGPTSASALNAKGMALVINDGTVTRIAWIY